MGTSTYENKTHEEGAIVYFTPRWMFNGYGGTTNASGWILFL